MMELSNKDKTIVVTGANCGLGLSAAYKLSKDGYDMILACRNVEKGQNAVTEIKKTQPDSLVTFMQVDLSDFSSVKMFVENFNKTDKCLYALVNNAGLTMPFTDTNRATTPDGLEITMASNYYGHFLLTNMLMDALKKGAESFGEARIVSVTSSLYDSENAKRTLRGKDLSINEIDFDDINMTKDGSYSGIQAYKNSKSAVIMFTYELSRRLEGTGVTATCLCPGFIPTTNLCRHSGRIAQIFMYYILPTMAKLMGKTFVVTEEEGTNRICNHTTSEDMKGATGKFYLDGAEAESKGETLDEGKQKQLWNLTEQIVGLKPSGQSGGTEL